MVRYVIWQAKGIGQVILELDNPESTQPPHTYPQDEAKMYLAECVRAVREFKNWWEKEKDGLAADIREGLQQ